MLHKGREIVAYRLRGLPLHIYIDVLQKDGDCIKEFGYEQRMSCPIDCQNTMASVVYNTEKGSIEIEGALFRKKYYFDTKKLEKNWLSRDDVKFLLMKNSSEIKFMPVGFGSFEIIYKNEPIGKYAECEFTVADNIESNDKEIMDYLEFLRGNPLKIMKECGINIYKKDNLTIITTSSEKNVKSDIDGIKNQKFQ